MQSDERRSNVIKWDSRKTVVNFNTEYVADRLGLIRHDAPKGLRIRTATSSTTPIRKFVIFDLNVASVAAEVRAYIVPSPAIPSYRLLLWRRWMQMVRAVGWYGKDRYAIMTADNKIHELEVGPNTAQPGSLTIPAIVIDQEISINDKTELEATHPGLVEDLQYDDITDLILYQVIRDSDDENVDLHQQKPCNLTKHL